MKPLLTFTSQFGAQIALNPEFIEEKAQRYYLLNPRLKRIAQGSFFCAGLYLGKIKEGIFFPSFNLLNMLVPHAANKVVVDRKAAWLFICGRDLFREGITKAMGTKRKGEFTLVLNEYGECLGFGRVVANFDQAEGRVVVQNVLDVGDFLRREKPER
jgi:ribosome biogenesis protein Nip4